MPWAARLLALLVLILVIEDGNQHELQTYDPDGDSQALHWIIYKAFGPSKRDGHSASFIERKMYVFGGCYVDVHCYNDLYVYDIARKQWLLPVPQGHIPPPRGHHSATIIEQSIWVFGGSLDGSFRSDTYVFNTSSWQWNKPSIKGTKPTPRSGHTAVNFDHKIYIFGGSSDLGYLNDLYCLDTVSLTWEKLDKVSGTPPAARGLHSAIRHKNRMYVFGGVAESVGDSNSFHAFDPVSRDWLAPSQLVTSGVLPRRRHSALMTKWNDMIIVIGGCNYRKMTCFNDTAVLDMTSMQWNVIPVLPESVANQSEPLKPENLIKDSTVAFFSAVPPAPTQQPSVQQVSQEKVEAAFQANQMAEQFATLQASDAKAKADEVAQLKQAAAKKADDGIGVMLELEQRLFSHAHSRLRSRVQSLARSHAHLRASLRTHAEPTSSTFPGPLEELDDESKLAAAVVHHLTPVGGLAGGFVDNQTGQIIVFGGCFLDKSCSYKLLSLTIPSSYKPPVDPFPIPNPSPKFINSQPEKPLPVPDSLPAPPARVQGLPVPPPTNLPPLRMRQIWSEYTESETTEDKPAADADKQAEILSEDLEVPLVLLPGGDAGSSSVAVVTPHHRRHSARRRHRPSPSTGSPALQAETSTKEAHADTATEHAHEASQEHTVDVPTKPPTSPNHIAHDTHKHHKRSPNSSVSTVTHAAQVKSTSSWTWLYVFLILVLLVAFAFLAHYLARRNSKRPLPVQPREDSPVTSPRLDPAPVLKSPEKFAPPEHLPTLPPRHTPRPYHQYHEDEEDAELIGGSQHLRTPRSVSDRFESREASVYDDHNGEYLPVDVNDFSVQDQEDQLVLGNTTSSVTSNSSTRYVAPKRALIL